MRASLEEEEHAFKQRKKGTGDKKKKGGGSVTQSIYVRTRVVQSKPLIITPRFFPLHVRRIAFVCHVPRLTGGGQSNVTPT